MRRMSLLLLTICLLVSLCGCYTQEITVEHHQRKKQEETTEATAGTEPATIPTEQTPETTEAPETTQAPTQPVELTPMTDVPYVLEPPSEACIFKEPDRDSDFVRVFGHKGAYTIVEERRHENGELWGRLKSGIGWVNLTDPFCGGKDVPIVVAAYASEEVLSGDYHLAAIHSRDAYRCQISILAHETVYDVQIVDVDDLDYSYEKTLYMLDELTPEKPIVAHLTFPGDLTTYEVVYTDAQGGKHHIRLWQSLDDSNMVVWF